MMMEVRDLRGVLDAVLSSNDARDGLCGIDGFRSGYGHLESEQWRAWRDESSGKEYETRHIGKCGFEHPEGNIDEPGRDRRIYDSEREHPHGIEATMRDNEGNRRLNAVGRVVVKHQWGHWLNHPTYVCRFPFIPSSFAGGLASCLAVSQC